MLEKTLQKIDVLKLELDSFRPLPYATLKSLRAAINLEWIYHSNAIEGNTLTLHETKVVLEGITIGNGKTLLEHFEAINHQDAIEFVESLIQTQEVVSEHNIKQIHALIMKNILPNTHYAGNHAGSYRDQNVIISGASTIPPHHILVAQEMEDLIEWYQLTNKQTQGLSAYPNHPITNHPILRAAKLHTLFVKIHPFIDGNGRTGRLLMNLDLMQAGFVPAIIRAESRLEYYDALDIACSQGDFNPISMMIAAAQIKTLELYLELLR